MFGNNANLSVKVYVGAHSLLSLPRKTKPRRGLATLEYAMLAGVAVAGFLLINRFILGEFIPNLLTRVTCLFDSNPTDPGNACK